MPYPILPVVGTRFGHIEIIEYLGTRVTAKRSRHYVKVRCDCGNEYDVFAMHLHEYGDDRGCHKCTKARRSAYQIGEKVDKLTIVGFIKNREGHGRNMVLRCDCGSDKDIILSSHQIGTNKTNNCGCAPRGAWEGLEEISKTFTCQLRSRAKARDIDVLISIEDIWKMYIEQDRRCALSGVEIFFKDHSAILTKDRAAKGDVKKKRREQTASLDRIDSDGEYSIDNVQLVHKTVNKMKQNLDEKLFIEFCKLIAENNK